MRFLLFNLPLEVTIWCLGFGRGKLLFSLALFAENGLTPALGHVSGKLSGTDINLSLQYRAIKAELRQAFMRNIHKITDWTDHSVAWSISRLCITNWNTKKDKLSNARLTEKKSELTSFTHYRTRPVTNLQFLREIQARGAILAKGQSKWADVVGSTIARVAIVAELSGTHKVGVFCWWLGLLQLVRHRDRSAQSNAFRGCQLIKGRAHIGCALAVPDRFFSACQPYGKKGIASY